MVAYKNRSHLVQGRPGVAVLPDASKTGTLARLVMGGMPAKTGTLLSPIWFISPCRQSVCQESVCQVKINSETKSPLT